MKKLLLFSLSLWITCLHAQTNFIHQDSVIARTADCQLGVAVCIDSFTYDDLSNYRFTLDGQPFNANFTACKVDTMHAYSYLVLSLSGDTSFSLERWVVNGVNFGNVVFNNLQALKDSMVTWNPSGQWQFDARSNNIIFGFANGSSYSCQRIVGLTSFSRNDICYNQGLRYAGLRFNVPTGRHQLIVEDLITLARDTVEITAACIRPDTVVRNIQVGTSDNYCVSSRELLGALQGTTNFCARATTHAVFQTPVNDCITFNGATVGSDTACLRYCDQFGICDTTYVVVNVTSTPNGRGHVIQDTITSGLSRTRCALNIPSGTIASVTNACPTSSGNHVRFTVDPVNRCVTYTGLTEGLDSACVVICNTNGVCDTNYFYIGTRVSLPPTGTRMRITDTLALGTAKPICGTLRGGGLTISGITNLCAGGSGTRATFGNLNTANGCSQVTSLSVGTDSACWKICYSNGVCDTIYMVMSVYPPESNGTRNRVTDTVAIGTNKTYCVPTRGGGLFVTGVTNLCAAASGTHVSFTNLDPVTGCVTITGLRTGTDTACLQICYNNNICDTFNVIMSAYPLAPVNTPSNITRLTDTILVGTQKNRCFTLRTGQTVTSFVNYCPQNGGNRVLFGNLNSTNGCVTLVGMRPGMDSACFRICYQNGTCDTIILTVGAYTRPDFANSGGNNARLSDSIAVGTNKPNCIPLRTGLTVLGMTNLCPSNSGNHVTFTNLNPVTGCVTLTGITPGADSACLQICYTNNVCDTIYISVGAYTPTNTPVVSNTRHIFRDTVFVAQTRRKCDYIAPAGTGAGFFDYCNQIGSNVFFDVNGGSRCVTYTGLAPGIDTVCIAVCNISGQCDTTFTYITVIDTTIRRHVLTDSVLVGSTGTQCNLPNPGGVLTTIRNLCAHASPFVQFTIDSVRRCVTYTGLTVGSDSVCMEICNAQGFCDTTTIRINARPNSNRIHRRTDTITIGMNREICNLVSPGGTISTFSNFCAGVSGARVDFTIDAIRNCIRYKGMTLGTDSACMRVCNTNGTCDTTYVTITTIPLVTNQNINDTITVGLNRIYCVPANDTRIMRTGCAPSNGGFATITIDTTTRCITYTGVREGTDSTCFVLCNPVTGRCDTIKVRIRAIPIGTGPLYYTDTITVGLNRTFCNLKRPAGGFRSIQYCTPPTGTNVVFALDTATRCIRYTGTAIGTDSTCVIICDSTGRCDTTYVKIQVKPVARGGVHYYYDTITVNTSRNKCDLAGAATGTSITNICVGGSGTRVVFTLNPVTKCVQYSGISIGIDSACIVICNATGICDTTYVRILGLRADIPLVTPSVDTVRMPVLGNRTYCPDQSELAGAPITRIEWCSPLNLTHSTVILDSVTKCVRVTGTVQGLDSVCVRICNAFGICDTTRLFIRVTPDTVRPTPSVDSVRLNVGIDSVFCRVDTSQIGGRVARIFNACPSRSGRATVTIDSITKCVRIRGVSVGRDTACIVVCNANGVCDTTTIYINVGRPNPSIILIANDDRDTVRFRGFRVLNIFANDTIRAAVTRFNILTPPVKGQLDTISRGIVRYRSGVTAESCGLDSFKYEVCTGAICDTAWVYIYVDCPEELKLWSAISPNNDGKNDVLIIDGLQNYPNHTLCIFNRWGNEVLRVKNYQQDWTGNWNGQLLPDGTYFYFLRDDDKGDLVKTGYIQLMR
jgi:gliding motility-associated-like protein